MRLCEWTCGALPDVPLAARESFVAGPLDRAAHARIQAELPALHALEVAAPPAPEPERSSARVVAWNAARGREPARGAAMLRAAGADAALLTELDAGMARSGQLHGARELAERLGMGFAFAVEFLELGLGTAAERARLSNGVRNERGLHGAAIASARPLERPALVRLDAGGDWFDGAREEPRVGGRIAVLATLRLGGAPVTLAAVHLENDADPARRDAQTAALLAAVDAYAPGAPALLGGDFNTHSLGVRELRERAALREALLADPTRFAHPERHEPLFARLERAGFACAPCNAGGATHFAGRERGGSAGGLRLDWFFARGLAVRDPAILPSPLGADGAALSDHEAIALTIALPAVHQPEG
jgi:endonuclease/exonuclease/phosphatase family metal-dependent hydrolase